MTLTNKLAALGLWGLTTGLFTYAVPVIWLSTLPGFAIQHVFYLSIATTTLQACLAMWLLRREFGKRLAPLAVKAVPEPVAAE